MDECIGLSCASAVMNVTCIEPNVSVLGDAYCLCQDPKYKYNNGFCICMFVQCNFFVNFHQIINVMSQIHALSMEHVKILTSCATVQ